MCIIHVNRYKVLITYQFMATWSHATLCFTPDPLLHCAHHAAGLVLGCHPARLLLQEGCHCSVQLHPRPRLQVLLGQLDQSVDPFRVALINGYDLGEGRIEAIVDVGWKDILQDGVNSWGAASVEPSCMHMQ